MAKHGRPQILEAPAQEAREQRVKKGDDNADGALLGVRDAEEY